MTIQVKTILLGTLFTRIALFMSTPFLAIYLSDVRQFSALEIGYIVGINPLVSVLGSSLGGHLSDKIKLYSLLSYTPIFWGVIFISFYFASSFSTFLLLNALSGLCYVLFEPATKRTLSAFSLPEQRMFIYNLRYAAINLGAFLGPLLGLLFSTTTSLFPYLILGSFYIIYGFVNRHTMKEAVIPITVNPTSVEKAANKTTPVVAYLLLLIGITFSYFAYAQFNSTVPQFFASSTLFRSGVTLYSMVLTMNAALILLLQLPVMNYSKKISSFFALQLSNYCFAFSLFLLPKTNILFVLFLMVFFYSLGELFLGVRFDYLIDQLAPSNKKGFYFGLAEMTKLGNSIGPVVGAYLIQLFSIDGYTTIFICLGIITLGGSLFIQLSSRFSK
jgi:MFS family permease